MLLMKKMISILTVFCLMAMVPQAGAQGIRDADAELSARGPRKQLGTIVFAGLAGAILGLSTLSFYGRPQDKLSNIALGFAFGVITGAVFTTYKAATDPKDFYNLDDRRFQPEAWSLLEARSTSKGDFAPQAGWTFEF